MVLVLVLRSVYVIVFLSNSQAVEKGCGPPKNQGEKRCKIQGGGQEMAVMRHYPVGNSVIFNEVAINGPVR